MKTECNGNLVPCEAITALDKNDSTPFDEFVKLYRQGGAFAHLRKPFLTDVLGKMEQMHNHCEEMERERANEDV